MTIESIKSRSWFMWLVIGLYVGAIVVANGAVTLYGQVALPFTSFALIPFDLIARDILQDHWQDRPAADLRFRMTLVIIAGAVISVLTGTGSARINLASFLAFMVAGAIDALTYQWMIRYGRIFRINGATITAAITDSIIFVLIAFDHTVWSLILFQVVMKVTGGFCWSLLLYRFFRKSEEVKDERVTYGCSSCEVIQVSYEGEICDACQKTAPCWEAVADEPSPEDEKEGRYWRVRWSVPDSKGRYLYVRHYGGNGDSWNKSAAESGARMLNEQGRRPTQYPDWCS